MSFITLMVLSAGLAMDAMCVSIASGVRIRDLRAEHALKVGLFFGAFQALMPLIGYAMGHFIAGYLVGASQFLACALLCFIGVQMIVSSFSNSNETTGSPTDPTATSQLLPLAFATSVDALAVGAFLAFVDADILVSAAVIGITAFTLSYFGVFLGKFLGGLFRRRANALGGLALIAIGIKILLQHLQIF